MGYLGTSYVLIFVYSVKFSTSNSPTNLLPTILFLFFFDRTFGIFDFFVFSVFIGVNPWPLELTIFY